MKTHAILTLVSCYTAVTAVPPAHAALDLNHDGLGDVWQQFYHAENLNPADDSDADGMSNAAEHGAGTDPLNRNSKFDIAVSAGPAPDQRNLTWPSVAGKSYTLESSSDMAVWSPAAAVVSGTGTTMTANVTLSPGTGRRYYRVTCTDTDSDGDSLSDWEERTACFNPAAAQTTPGTDDAAALSAALTAAGNVLTIVTDDGQAFESAAGSGAPEGGLVRLVRTGGLSALTISVAVSGRPAGGADYLENYTTPVQLAFGCNTVSFPLTPVKDAHLEVPETLTFTLADGPGYTRGTPDSGSVRIDDFEDQTERLYFAPLSAVTEGGSTGSGYATIWLNGDHTGIRTSLSFTGLTSAQPSGAGARMIHAPTREILHSLSAGQVIDNVWTFPESGVGSLSSDQALLDSLTSNQMSILVLSLAQPTGELTGDFAPAEGSFTFTPPDDPGPPPAYSGTEADKDVERFIAQATFGASDSLTAEVKAKGISTWIDEQMNPALTPASSLLSYTKASDDWLTARAIAAGLPDDRTPLFESLPGGWWLQSAAGRDQLRQRVAFALSEIFVVSLNNSTVRNRHYGTADFYDTLARNAFGSFRTLLEDVTLHPTMANYLSMVKNEKYNAATGVSPDENYAREIMQLFTIGLVQLHPDGTLVLDGDTVQPMPTYDNSHITELAKVFTGWSYSKTQTGGLPLLSQWNNDGTIADNNSFSYNGGTPYGQAAFYHPLKMFQTRHDTGAKNIVNGVTIPAGQTGEADLDMAMDALCNHPNTPPFIARRLIQRLVTSNPSRGYVYRVANKFINDGTGVRGNLAAVVRATLTDYEARTLTIADQAGYGKQREPLVAFLHLYRALNGTSGTGAQFFDTGTLTASSSPPYSSASIPAGTRLFLVRPSSTVNQSLPQLPLTAPSVFNWFQPDYTYPGEIQSNGLVAPEFQLTNETSIVTNPNFFYGLIYNLPSGGTNPGPQPGNVAGAGGNWTKLSLSLTAAQSALTAGGTSGLVDYFDRLLCARQLSTETRSAVLTAINGITDNNEKIRTALYLIHTSPDYMIQR